MRALKAFLAPAVVGLALAEPAAAQDRDSELQALRSELAQARSTIDRLSARLEAVEAASQPPPEEERTSEATGLILRTSAPPAATAGEWGRTWALSPVISGTQAPGRERRGGSVELVAGPDGGRAAFALSRTVDADGPRDGDAYTVISDTTELNLSAPLSKDGDTPFATLDGLSTGTKLKFEFTRGWSRVLTQAADDASPLLQQARQRCRDASPAYEFGCRRLDDAFKTRFFEGDELARYEAEYARQTLQRSHDWSFNAAIGYDEFAWYPVPGLTKTTEDELSWSAGAGLTVYPFARGSAGLDLAYELSYDDEDPATVCPVALPGQTTVTCVPGPLVGPERTEKIILGAELRYIHPLPEDWIIPALGFAPRFEFDLMGDDVAVDLPIYFAPDAEDGLTGGVRFGYVSDKDEFKFGVFVGKAFSIFR